LRAEGFFYNLDILYGGLEIGNLQFLKKKKHTKKISAVIFFKFLVIKALDPDWIRIRIGLQPQTLDPDPDWSPASNSGSGSGKNEYGSTTLKCRMGIGWLLLYDHRSCILPGAKFESCIRVKDKENGREDLS
jgi:hypothetical protein